jgi:hypothetical protein
VSICCDSELLGVFLNSFYDDHLFIFVMLFSDEARNQFKEFVNAVATIRNEEVTVYFLLIKC